MRCSLITKMSSQFLLVLKARIQGSGFIMTLLYLLFFLHHLLFLSFHFSLAVVFSPLSSRAHSASCSTVTTAFSLLPPLSSKISSDQLYIHVHGNIHTHSCTFMHIDITKNKSSIKNDVFCGSCKFDKVDFIDKNTHKHTSK